MAFQWRFYIRSSELDCVGALAFVLGFRAVLCRSGCCITLHAVGTHERARTIMPHTRGVARVDATHLKRGS